MKYIFHCFANVYETNFDTAHLLSSTRTTMFGLDKRYKKHPKIGGCH